MGSRGGDTRNWLHAAEPVLAHDSIGRGFWKCVNCSRRVHQRRLRGVLGWVHTGRRRGRPKSQA